MMPVLVGVAVVLLPLLRPAGPANTAAADVFLAAVVALGLLRMSRDNLEIRLPYGLGAGLMMFGGIVAAMLANAPWTSIVVIAQDLLLLLWAGALALGARDVNLVAAVVRAWCLVAPAYAAVMVFAYIGGLSASRRRDRRQRCPGGVHLPRSQPRRELAGRVAAGDGGLPAAP